MNSTFVPVLELQQSQLQALRAFSSALFDATEKFTTLNFSAARALLQESTQASQNLLDTKDAPAALARAGGLVQPSAERWVNYSRNALGIASGTNAELAKIVDEQVAEGNRRFVDWIEVALKDAPAGSETAASLLKSAVVASNTAYENVSSAARQALALAETSLAVTTEVTTEIAHPRTRKTS